MMLDSLFSDTVSNISISSILICSLVSIILGFFIAMVHKKTCRSNKNFLVTLTILPLLVMAIMIMVNGNLGTSVAIVGAFSLVRFRSLPGTSKEILSVIFSMTIGLSTGMGHVLFATLIAILAIIVLLLFEKVKIFDNNKKEKILRIVIPESLDYTNVFDEEFSKYVDKVTLEQVKTINMGSLFELSYRIILNKDTNEKEFIDDLRIKNGNLKIMLSHPIDEISL